MKKVIIVGAGIAGLAAGVYARQSGFDVTILEQHTIPGGNSTSWRRGGYLFEGGMHWLNGSSPKTPLHTLWRKTGAVNDTTPIYNSDPFITYIDGEKKVCLYRDPERMKEHFLEVSPEDRKEIMTFYRDLRKFQKLKVPIFDLFGLRVRKRTFPSLPLLFDLLGVLPRLTALKKISTIEYADRFRNPAIRALIKSSVNGQFSGTSLMFTLGGFAGGDGGYPEGGSLQMAVRMADFFKSLGGEIRYSARVEKIKTEKGMAGGVIADGNFLPADAVIVTADTLTAIDKFFDEPLRDPWMNTMRKKTLLVVNTFISLGIEADLSDKPEKMILPLEKPFTYAGVTVSSVTLNNYAAYDGYAPKGASACTVMLGGDTYDYWKQCRDEGTYKKEKEALAKVIIERLSEKLPEIKDKVRVWDVATPLTYERYCGTYRGSWMTILGKRIPQTQYPCKPKSFSNVYFAGQRMYLPGGLPVAVMTGRRAVQYLCRDTGTVFEGKLQEPGR
ncbi:phytoene desaturase family protein [Brucepastera parasyntrophica]|uniref:phytoene desaturase family protein n=1 Tax=Brucepastera parasyntrophica TaxID=2880008 RepID=UPI00272E6F3B|nr:FAD-dependent oxidoreductase [Brucepastera parasyntrophica]